MPESNKTNNIQVGGIINPLQEMKTNIGQQVGEIGQTVENPLHSASKLNAMKPDKLVKNKSTAMQGQATAMQDQLSDAMDPTKLMKDKLKAMNLVKVVKGQVSAIKSKYLLQFFKMPASVLQAIGIGFLFALASFANGIVYYSTSVINIPENTLTEILQSEEMCKGLGFDETECNTKIKCFLKKCGHFDRPKKKKKEDTSVQMGGYSLSKNSKKKRKRKRKREG